MDPYLVGNIYTSLHGRISTERDLQRVDLPTEKTSGLILERPPCFACVTYPLVSDDPIYTFKMNLEGDEVEYDTKDKSHGYCAKFVAQKGAQTKTLLTMRLHIAQQMGWPVPSQ